MSSGNELAQSLLRAAIGRQAMRQQSAYVEGLRPERVSQCGRSAFGRPYLPLDDHRADAGPAMVLARRVAAPVVGVMHFARTIGRFDPLRTR